MSASSAKHHYIAQSFLALFTQSQLSSAGESVGVFRVTKQAISKSKPSEIAYEKGYNSIDLTSSTLCYKNNYIESLLSGYETQIQTILVNPEAASVEELKSVIAVQEARLPRNRNYLAQSSVLELAYSANKLTIQDIQNLSVIHTLKLILNIFDDLDTIKVVRVNNPLLLSDNPVVTLDTKNRVQLGISKISEWGFMPISRDKAVVFNFKHSVNTIPINFDSRELNKMSLETSSNLLFWDLRDNSLLSSIASEAPSGIATAIGIRGFGLLERNIIWAPFTAREWFPHSAMLDKACASLGTEKMIDICNMLLQLRRSDNLFKATLNETLILLEFRKPNLKLVAKALDSASIALPMLAKTENIDYASATAGLNSV